MTAAEEILEESAGDLAEALDPLGVFLARAGRCLSALAPAPGAPLANPQGDHSLDPNPDAVRPALPYRSAAVLVPVIVRERGLHIVLTQRAAHLRDHSGQVAFPGGKIEPGDPDPAAAALREAGEEIGLSPDAVRVLGYLDPYLSATGFLVVPVVALVAEGTRFVPDPAEVAEVFEVPLDFLLDASRYGLNSRLWQGRTRYYYALPFEGRVIWGVTAGILNNLRERLAAAR